MKKIKLISIAILSMITVSAFANQTCPSQIIVQNGQYVPAGGWQVTSFTLSSEGKKAPVYPMAFDIASYGYDQTHKYNHKQISCGYKVAGDAVSYIEITSQNSYPKPIPTKSNHWEISYQNTETCGDPLGYATNAQCSWE